ncbi:MAG: asparaginase [Bacteroidales bacterium]|nr:MAG: asparaginase [Bacteroidales bacterium]
MKIKIISAGGTIDKVYFDRISEYKVGKPQIIEMLKEANFDLDLDFKSILKKDSLDFTDKDRLLIKKTVEKDNCRHIVITHGTDTMIETASILKDIPGKVIVLTGSMQPANFKFSDAPYNIACALMAVQLLKPGAYIVMNGKVFNPVKIQKDRKSNKFLDLRSK